MSDYKQLLGDLKHSRSVTQELIQEAIDAIQSLLGERDDAHFCPVCDKTKVVLDKDWCDDCGEE